MAPPPRPLAPARPLPVQRASTSYSLELLSEYAHTLDAMPLELSRIFADLRELDAVLTSTVASVVSKIYKLIEMIEDRSASSEQRLWLLGEIAEEASKIRPGADDKIRIATQAADSLHSQKDHLTALAMHLPEFEPAMLVPKTRYPHVSHRAYMPPHTFETGRRRRAPVAGTIWLGLNDPSPKKRKVVQDEDADYGTASKSPRKEKTGESAGAGPSRPRGGPRTKKVERHPSPPESVASLAHHPPANATSNAVANQRSSGTTSHRNPHNAPSSNKRRANNQNGAAHGEGSLLESVLSRKDNQHLAPSTSTSHPSLGDVFDNGKRDKDYWPNENGRDLQAPSTSKARASTQSSLTTNLASALEGSPAPGDAGATESLVADGAAAGVDGATEVDGEADDGKIYCFCDNGSYGEMIGCDEPNCRREWFHLSCVGLKEAPKGVWYCDECASQRKNPRNPRKKRSGGGKPNGKANGS
ncbi:hypothetical protein ACEPAI_145 [Sanghuangporus weigelae]